MEIPKENYIQIPLSSTMVLPSPEKAIQAEETLRRLNRKLLAISSCNQVLIRAVDEQTLLNDICRIICDETGYRMAWVGYAENDDAKSVRPVAWAGVEDGYLATANITWADTEQGRGPTGTAIRTGEMACIRDFTTDPKAAPWRDGGLRRGYQSSIALPLKDESGSTFGALNIYSTEPDTFTTIDEVRLLEELTCDLAFGIEVLRARNASREAERSIALLNFALDNVHEAAELLDKSARFRYVNEEASRALGYSCSELLELGVPDIDPDFSMELWHDRWEELKGRGSMSFETRHRAKDGRMFPVEICANYFEYEGEQFIFSLVRDITERKRYEEALRESEQRYRMLADNVNDMVWVRDMSGRLSYVSPSDERLTGFSADESMARTIDETLTPSSAAFARERLTVAVGRILAGQRPEPERLELEERRKDGSIMDIEVNVSAMYDSAGEFAGFLGVSRDITERKRVENVLRESEERFRTLTEKSLVGVYIIQDDLFRYVNPALAEMFGYAPEEIIDRLGPVDFLTPEDRERVLDSIRRRMAGEIEFSHHEFHISRKDGSIRAVEAFGSHALHKGRPAVLGTIIDVTERKRSEEKLIQATERWERTFDAVPDLIAIVDTDFRIVQVNKAMADRLGATPAKCAGQLCYAAVHKTEAPPSFCPYVQTLRDSGEHMEEVSEERLGGDFIVSTSPIYDSSGQLVGSVHVARDITKRKRAEQDLEKSRNYLDKIINSIADPIFVKDWQHRWVLLNDSYCRFTGYNRDELLGKSDYDFFPKNEADVFREKDELVFAYGGENINEEQFTDANGIVHKISTKKTVYTDEKGEKFIVGVIRDITSLKKAEEERKMLEAQLHQAQKMESIGQLAGGIAHDFNNILTAIRGFAEIVLLKMEKGNPFRRHLEQILASSDRAAELTNGLLAFSRRQVLHAKPMDLCGVLRGFEKMLGRLVPEDIDFRTTVAGGDLIVMADKGQIEQVLMNLVTNAKDAMPMGGNLTIEVYPAVMEERFAHADGFGEPGDYACVTVSDTGEGMDEETRKRIFEPFFTTKEVGKGTGLGMAIIYGIIQQHNGCISVYSEKEMGTTFRIYLPLIAEGIREVDGTRESEPPPGGTETVLLAEDDAAVLELHRMILQEAGYRVIEAVDGRDALDKFTEHRTEVDILATDVVMPKINGKSLYEEIRKIRPEMKVLFMSGYTKEIIVERGILEDEFSVITKPVTSSELLKKMREILDWNRL
jgi:two-component system cell cycle sensor histidine kinase/response regulator CckA